MSDLFSDEPTKVQTPPQGGDEIITKLSSIVNEQGQPKYKDVDTAIDALKASQEYIPSLKTELSQRDSEIQKLREELSKQKGFQEALEQFGQKTEAQPQKHEATPNETVGNQDVESLVQKQFETYMQKSKQEENLNKILSEVSSKYGDQAKDYIATKAKELGTTPSEFGNIAKNNPTMARTLLGLTEAKQSTALTSGGTKTVGFAPKKEEGLKAPSTSMLEGTKREDLMSFMNSIKRDVYTKLDITE